MLLGDIPGAYEQAFNLERSWDENVELDSDLEPLIEGMVEVKLSKETFSRIRAPWSKALIVKVFGRTVGFNYLTFKINALWKPMAKLDCVNLGKDFFLIRFSSKEDYDKVLKGGPWFVGEHYLSVRKWEPKFQAAKATVTSLATWIRLPELPIEFFHPETLRSIGNRIGRFIRIDAITNTIARGRFARLCVQLDMDKPLWHHITIGSFTQPIQYEKSA